jgi:hypothetical protein
MRAALFVISTEGRNLKIQAHAKSRFLGLRLEMTLPHRLESRNPGKTSTSGLRLEFIPDLIRGRGDDFHDFSLMHQ